MVWVEIQRFVSDCSACLLWRCEIIYELSAPVCEGIEIAAIHWVIKVFTTVCAFREVLGVPSWDFPICCLYFILVPLSQTSLSQAGNKAEWCGGHRGQLGAVLGVGEKPAAAGWWHIGRLLRFSVGDTDRRSSTWFWMGKADARTLGSWGFNRSVVLVLCGEVASFGNSNYANTSPLTNLNT